MDLCKDCNDQDDVKQALQKNRLKHHYNHVYLILKQKGISIPSITFQEREQLIAMFKSIVLAYGKLRQQVNMLSYHFLLGKLFVRINRLDLLPFLSKLKSVQKNREYEDLWTQIEALM
jgi:hypothetical protein